MPPLTTFPLLARPSQIYKHTNADSLLARASFGPTNGVHFTGRDEECRDEECQRLMVAMKSVAMKSARGFFAHGEKCPRVPCRIVRGEECGEACPKEVRPKEVPRRRC